MSLNTSAYAEYEPGKQGSASLYGHADYARDKAAGISDSALLAKINANPSAMGNGGVGGDLYRQIQAGANSGGGGGGGGGGYAGGSVGAGAGAFNPANVNFNPGGIDMGGQAPTWSNQEFIRGLAKDRAQEFTNGSVTNTNQSISNNIEQNIGNKGDMETNIENSTINNSLIGNDYSLNLGSINLANQQFAY
jgi:hypothetical protein